MPLDISRIRALCFDVDGTLSDTDDVMVTQLSRFLKPLRVFFTDQKIQSTSRWIVMGAESPGNLMYHLLDRWNLDDNVARLMNRLAHLQNGRTKKRFSLIPQAGEALHGLSPHFPMAVVTARGSKGTMAFLEQYHLSPLFHAVASSQTCRYTKPFPDPVIWAANQMGVEPQECLMIGDTTVDIRAGKAAGAQTVGVLCGFGHEDELLRAGADLILPGPYHLLKILLQQ